MKNQVVERKIDFENHLKNELALREKSELFVAFEASLWRIELEQLLERANGVRKIMRGGEWF